MSSSSSLLLHLSPPPPPPPPSLSFKPQTSPHFTSLSFHLPRPRTLSITFSSSPSSSFEREEARWLREEQRWLREEQRWLREESRWSSERQTLLQEIESLRSQLQALGPKKLRGGSESSLLLKEVEVSSVEQKQKQISVTGSSSVPMMLEEKKEEEVEVEEEVKEMIVKEVRAVAEEVKKVEKRRMTALRIGAEGDEVQAMQDALLNQGFYSGEEEMEFAVFSTGTERAIKTWQASIGVAEDGVMTAELLEKLFGEQETVYENSTSTLEKENSNGVPVANLTEVPKTKPIEADDAEADPSYHKVFLLGENRWEDSSRLTKKDKKTGERVVEISTTKCVACHGEGNILCTECDGTGEPNVESQFLEWVDEDAKCPYCEGLGYSICDVCEGKTIIHP